jgi:excisionase family DNA binding protein
MLHRTDVFGFTPFMTLRRAVRLPGDGPGYAGALAGASIGGMTLAEEDLSTLVTEWLDWRQVADRLGVSEAKVRTMVRDHELAAAVPRDGTGLRVPADLLDEDGLPVKGLAGLLTLLHDGGYDDREIIAWLYLDANLPGRPIDALRENRGAEVKRRAQAMAL